MDLDATRGLLVQEARELLSAMEDALLSIEREGGASAEAINAIFRAAHTIKGSAGLFALNGVVTFTHVLESVLDKVRAGNLQLDDRMFALLLKCSDYIGLLIDGIENSHENDEPDQALRTSLMEGLQAYLQGTVTQSPAPEVPLTPKAAPPTSSPLNNDQPVSPDRALFDAPPLEASGDGDVGNDYWHISLRFAPDLLRNGMDPLGFLRYLATLGRIVSLYTLTDTLPALDDMDPELCYFGFEIEFESSATKQTIENVFEFVREDGIIHIIPPHSKISEFISLIETLPESSQKLGSILVADGALTQNELDSLLSHQNSAPDGTDKPLLGTLLVEAKLVDEPVVAAALVKQKQGEEHKAQEQKFIKVETSKLDLLINLVGELVIASAAAKMVARQSHHSFMEEASATIAELVEQIRDASLNLRMVPVGDVFKRFPRVVRDISKDLDKQIELVITGSETELDKSMVEKLSDPLMHIVRNAADHGLEPREERLACGKPETGTLKLNAFHDSGSIVIEVSDNGRGLDYHRIRAKGIERGLISADQLLSEAEIFKLIFEPGFSTAERVTNLSGRGVGMDVVKKNIEQLRGEVDMESVPGNGTTVRIRLPLTLAIIDGFQVMVGSTTFVIPLDMVVECMDLSSQTTQYNIVHLRGKALPFVRLREVFQLPEPAEGKRENLVVVRYAQHEAGLVVDRLLGEFQAVIKPLGSLLSGVHAISGSTILGDGRVALILDVQNLVNTAAGRTVAVLEDGHVQLPLIG